MPYDYSKLTITAQNMINKFGRSFTKRSTTTTGDAWNPTVTNVDTSIFGVFTDFHTNEIDGTLVKATDKKILTYTEVTIADKIVDGSIVYSVIAVSAIQPGADKIIYKVQVRI